jgi:hypothetical protein
VASSAIIQDVGLGANLSFAFGQPPLVMFSLIIFFSITAEITGNLAQLYLYRKGV